MPDPRFNTVGSRQPRQPEDIGRAERVGRRKFKVLLQCGHERLTEKVRAYHGMAMCKECVVMVPMVRVRMDGAWLPLNLALVRLRIHDGR